MILINSVIIYVHVHGMNILMRDEKEGKIVKQGSPNSALMRRPNSFSRASDFGPIAPKVSMAMGENLWPGGRPRYFSLFRSSAAAATFPFVFYLFKETSHGNNQIFYGVT